MFYGHVRSMLTNSGIEDALRNNLWVEAATTTTTLYSVLIPKDGMSPNDIFWEGTEIVPALKKEKLANRVL